MTMEDERLIKSLMKVVRVIRTIVQKKAAIAEIRPRPTRRQSGGRVRILKRHIRMNGLAIL